MKPFKSVFGKHLAGYVALRKRLGLKFRGQTDILHAFDRFVVERENTGPLTQELAVGFACAQAETTRRWQAGQYHVIRNFAEYLAAYDPATPVLHRQALVASGERRNRIAYIFRENDLGLVQAKIDDLPGSERSPSFKPFRTRSLRVAIGLGACTGMRLGEVAGLDDSDFDPAAQTLLIRNTKFSKDRVIPIHESACQELLGFIEERDGALPKRSSSALFRNVHGQRLSRDLIGRAFSAACRLAGLTAANGRNPTFHDLRHTFAVRRLIAWYREGRDVQVMLPRLATYMGHVQYSYTAWYLGIDPELLGAAAERFFSWLQNGEVRP